jgi:hypothetical protein
MEVEGGCYCRATRYKAVGDPVMQLVCFCRECQIVSGGGPVVIFAMPEAGFEYTRGEAKSFTRSDLEAPVTREFCPECGTHLLTRAPGLPAVMLKVGGLDDPSVYTPGMAIFVAEKQPYHTVPEGIPTFDGMPG